MKEKSPATRTLLLDNKVALALFRAVFMASVGAQVRLAGCFLASICFACQLPEYEEAV